tara:strand:- start:278 stop:505 length:228 start_codon:yes stop_codon:yes gene_type:complete
MEIKLEINSESELNGVLIELNVIEGQEVEKGCILAVVELDKTNLEIESPVDGTVKKINFSVNDNIQVGDTILIIK